LAGNARARRCWRRSGDTSEAGTTFAVAEPEYATARSDRSGRFGRNRRRLSRAPSSRAGHLAIRCTNPAASVSGT
jgi:hypothetical protein